MPSHRFCDFIKGFSARRAAQVKHCEAIRRRTGLQKAFLQGLPQWVSTVLPLTQISQAIKKLSMIGRQDHYLRILSAKD